MLSIVFLLKRDYSQKIDQLAFDGLGPCVALATNFKEVRDRIGGDANENFGAFIPVLAATNPAKPGSPSLFLHTLNK